MMICGTYSLIHSLFSDDDGLVGVHCLVHFMLSDYQFFPRLMAVGPILTSSRFLRYDARLKVATTELFVGISVTLGIVIRKD